MLERLKKIFRSSTAIKSNPTGPLFVYGFGSYGNNNLKSMNYEIFSREGYVKNVIVYRCIREIVSGACTIDIEARRENEDGEMEHIPNHPAIALLDAANPMQPGESFMEALLSYYLINGDTFLIKNTENMLPPTELWTIQPDKVEVIPGEKGTPKGYKVQGSAAEQFYPFDVLNNSSQILQIKNFNPTSSWRGMSSLFPALLSFTTHNDALTWNNALLKNNGKPSGLLKAKTDFVLSDEQRTALKKDLNEAYTGAENAGRPMILGADLDWQQMSLSPLDMDYNTTTDVMARNIAAAFGVPFPLVVPESATYSNVAESREMLFENTIVPMMQRVLKVLSYWLMPFYGDEYKNTYLCINEDTIPALEGKRQRKFDRMVQGVNAGILSRDEARRELGYEEVGGAAGELFVASGLIPIEMAGEADVALPSEDAGVAKALKDAGVEVKSLTNFPVAGEDMEVDLKNSQFPEFDFDYAQSLKKECPTLWKMCANARGAYAFQLWQRYRAGEKSKEIIQWIKEREAIGIRRKTLSPRNLVSMIKWGISHPQGAEVMKHILNKKKEDYANR